MLIFFLFRASLWTPTSGKNFMVIPSVVPEISGGCTQPPDVIKLSEKADKERVTFFELCPF